MIDVSEIPLVQSILSLINLEIFVIGFLFEEATLYLFLSCQYGRLWIDL